MALAFRNVVADPSRSVETWPYEALVAAIERGSVRDVARLTAAMRREPWGSVARQVEDYLGYEMPYGVGPLLQRVIVRSRREREADERREVAARVDHLIEQSGLSAADFALLVGTSASRLSTYRTGKVVPSAAMMLRMESTARSG